MLGIVTLENILEQLIQRQIYDEKDRKFTPATDRLKWAVEKWKSFTLASRRRQHQDDDEDVFNFVEMGEVA